MKEINDEYSSQAGYPYVPELAPTQEKPKGVVENVKDFIKLIIKK